MFHDYPELSWKYYITSVSRMIALPGTGWTPYMFAVARTCISEESVNRKDSIIILDIVTSIYADHKDEMTVLQYVTIPNALDMTAMGKKKVNLMTLYVLWLIFSC